MRLLRDAITSFAGGVNDSVAPDEYLPHQVQLMINARPSLLGNSAEWMDWAERRSSGINFGATGGASDPYASACFGAIEFVTSGGAQQLVAAFDDQMYYSTDQGRNWTLISGATGLDVSFWSFAIMTEGGTPVLCAANGGSSAYQWDGSTWSTISGIPSGVKHLAIHGNRLIASGYSGSQVAASKVGDIDTWSIPDGWVVNADDGSDAGDVTGLYSIGGVILVFKRRSFGYTEGYGYETLQVAAGARGISRSVGCVGFRTIAPLGDSGLMWLSERGFEYYQVGGPVTLMSGFQQRFVDKIGTEALKAHPGCASAIWVSDRQEYWCAVPLGVGAGNVPGNSRVTWIYIFRPGNTHRPSSAYFRYPTASSDSTLTIDSDTGELGVSESDIVGGYMGFVNDEGMLDVCTLPDPGLWMQIDGADMLDFKSHLPNPSTLFTLDDGPRLAAPFMGTYENGIMALGRPSSSDLNMIRNGDFGSDEDWTTNGATISGGVATFDGVTISPTLTQWMPLVPGRTYRVTFEVSDMTTNNLRIFLGTGPLFSVSANGPYSFEREVEGNVLFVTPPRLQFETTGAACDAVIDNVKVVDVTGDPLPHRGIIRTRPLTYGDEFTRKKAKRIAVLAKQDVPHTATLYALTDGVYGTARPLSFTRSDSAQEKRVRTGGRGRVVQAELHLEAECLVDGIEIDAQMLGDQP